MPLFSGMLVVVEFYRAKKNHFLPTKLVPVPTANDCPARWFDFWLRCVGIVIEGVFGANRQRCVFVRLIGWALGNTSSSARPSSSSAVSSDHACLFFFTELSTAAPCLPSLLSFSDGPSSTIAGRYDNKNVWIFFRLPFTRQIAIYKDYCCRVYDNSTLPSPH